LVNTLVSIFYVRHLHVLLEYVRVDVAVPIYSTIGYRSSSRYSFWFNLITPYQMVSE